MTTSIHTYFLYVCIGFGHAPLSTNATTTTTNNSLLSVCRRYAYTLHSIHLYARTADIECMFVCGIYVCVEVREHNVERIVLSNEKEYSSWSVVQAAQAKMHIRDVGIQVWLLSRNELPPINLHCHVCMTSQMRSNIGTCVSLLLFVSTAACVLEDLQARDNERREKKKKESGNNRYHDTKSLIKENKKNLLQ
uniref:Uncharacterized protein n=1 Tax=Trichogramma kaykai TaxID=54128 RepID=A0ABD2WSP4_9HYME